MPIFSYFAVVGAALVALLFVADAKFHRQEPLALSSNFEGLPKPWKPELHPPLPLQKPEQIAAAPPLDPKWNEPKPTTVAAAPQPEPPAQKTAKAEPAPKKQKHVARKQPRRETYTQRYAWRHDERGGWFGGGGGGYGNPWRF